MGNDKLDILEFNINRIDGYIEKADNKASFLLALNGAFIGIILSQLNSILNLITINQNYKIINSLVCFSILILCLSSVHFCLKTIDPRKSKSNGTYKSILYYRDIVATEKYKKNLNKKTKNEDILQNEFCIQVKELSKICDLKMNNVNSAIKFLKLYIGIMLVYSIICCLIYIF